MTILKLLVGPTKMTLIESGEGYEHASHFSSGEELTQYLGKLGLLAWQLYDLRAGRIVGIASDPSWRNQNGQGLEAVPRAEDGVGDPTEKNPAANCSRPARGFAGPRSR